VEEARGCAASRVREKPRARTPSLSMSNLTKVTLRYSGALLRLLMNLVISACVRDCCFQPGRQSART